MAASAHWASWPWDIIFFLFYLSALLYARICKSSSISVKLEFFTVGAVVTAKKDFISQHQIEDVWRFHFIVRHAKSKKMETG